MHVDRGEQLVTGCLYESGCLSTGTGQNDEAMAHVGSQGAMDDNRVGLNDSQWQLGKYPGVELGGPRMDEHVGDF